VIQKRNRDKKEQMQITLQLKGFLKIALFFVVVLGGISYAGYKAWRFFSYKEILHKTALKRIANFGPHEFDYKMEIKDTSEKGYLLLAPYVRFNLRYGKMVIMDLSGNLLYEKEFNGAIIDFRQWHINGQTLYSYGIDDSGANHITLSAGHIVILDSALNEIRQIHLLPYNGIRVSGHEDLDLHDFIMLPGDHYIAMAVYEKTVDNIPVSLYPATANKVATTIIQEVQSGVVTWQWDGSKFPEFYLNSVVGNNFYDTTATQDYMHANSMAIDPRDSNLIVSLRQLNQVVKISRLTGAIIWRLGGKNSDFPLTTQQAFLLQHNAIFADDKQTLLVFDNGDRSARHFSRILEFRMDEQKKTIISFRAFIIPEPFTESLGSVQKTGDDYLISGGTANYVLRINSITGKKKMELKANQSTYRAYLVKDINGIKVNKKQEGK